MFYLVLKMGHFCIAVTVIYYNWQCIVFSICVESCFLHKALVMITNIINYVSKCPA